MRRRRTAWARLLAWRAGIALDNVEGQRPSHIRGPVAAREDGLSWNTLDVGRPLGLPESRII